VKVELIDRMGSDLSAVNAARVSFDKESEWEEMCPCGSTEPCYSGYCRMDQHLSERDQKLITYLAKHDHWTPFAHTALQFRVSAPVPIRTQCFKHKQGLVENEESRRYISSRPELYVPEYFRSKPEGSIKQGSGDEHENSGMWLVEYQKECQAMIGLYVDMVDDGVCPEQARFVLPQGVEVNWIWTGNLYAFANFYNKRTDPHAQKEIQELAKQLSELVEPLFPHSWKALTE
jgi:thymidylate synthase (FAD)